MRFVDDACRCILFSTSHPAVKKTTHSLTHSSYRGFRRIHRKSPVLHRWLKWAEVMPYKLYCPLSKLTNSVYLFPVPVPWTLWLETINRIAVNATIMKWVPFVNNSVGTENKFLMSSLLLLKSFFLNVLVCHLYPSQKTYLVCHILKVSIKSVLSKHVNPKCLSS